MPLDHGASGTLTRSRLAHVVGSREKPSKRKKEDGAEEWIKEPPVEAVLEASLEAVEAVIEVRVQEPTVEARSVAPIKAMVEAGMEPAAEARVDSVRKTPVQVLGVNLAGSPQPYQQG